MKKRNLLHCLIALGAAAWLPSCTTTSPTSKANPDPRTDETMVAMSKKIAAAKTIRLTAKHKKDPALGVGSKAENGPIEITVKRPNQFYCLQPAGDQTRELAYDGKTLCMIHPGPKHHALEPVRAASISQFADRVDERFGFRPPIAELLATDVLDQLMLNVTSATVTEGEWVGMTRCKRLHFVQEGMTGDLWVGVNDQLPHRYLLTFTGLKGSPTWDIKLSKWELDGPVDDRLFSKRAAADSTRLKMLKSR
ncbi:MAG: hypothetical protein ACI8XO_001488 [Verrucomicrobiales bacterium]|jgi:hypothetical protein